MKHLKKGRKLSRVRRQRTALKRTLLGSLIMEEKIITTEAKAKEIKPLFDKLVTKVKKSQETPEKKVAIIRDLKNRIPQKAVNKMMDEKFNQKFKKRSSGYTRIIKLTPRASDSARMAVIEIL